MTVNYPQATDEINKLFNDAWTSGAPSLTTYVPEIRWYGNEKAALPNGSQFWVRHSIQNVSEEQTTVSTCEGRPGQTRYTGYGLVFMQLFCPKSIANSLFLGRQLAMVAKNAYRSKKTDGGVWFRNFRINELDAEEPYYRLNIIGEYEYDELY